MSINEDKIARLRKLVDSLDEMVEWTTIAPEVIEIIGLFKGVDAAGCLRAPVTVDSAKWSEDAAGVATVANALSGHHPERGGDELEAAAYAALLAARESDKEAQ